jgi:putative oxidoreductase
MAHAAVRIVHGTIPQFGAFMESVGFPQGEVLVWTITLAELVAGAAMIANRYVTQASATLIMIAATGILLIHRHFGWFVGEHGTGGSEYSVALMAALIVIIAADRDANASMSGTRQT